MFVALIERTGAETIRLWEHELRAAPDPAERLRRVLRANPMVTTKGRGAYRVIIQAMTEVEDPKIQQALNEHIHRLHDFLAAEVARAQEAGNVSKRFGADVTAWALIHLGLGYGVLAAMGLHGTSRDNTGLSIQEMLGKLMLGDTSTSSHQVNPTTPTPES